MLGIPQLELFFVNIQVIYEQVNLEKFWIVLVNVAPQFGIK
jgi:hypothetical protein